MTLKGQDDSQQSLDNIDYPVQQQGQRSYKRGLHVDWSDYKILDEYDNDSVPDGWEKLDESCQVIVPKMWLTLTLAKCEDKGPSFIVKKLMDGFYKPEHVEGQTAINMLQTDMAMQALKMFAINRLQMDHTRFTHVVNQKIATLKRGVKKNKHQTEYETWSTY